MKREELTALGLDREMVDRIMAIHGADIERHKKEAAGLGERLARAEKGTEGLRRARREADEWKRRYTALEEESQAQRYRRACSDAAGALRFTSAGARESFLRRLGEAKLPLDGEGFSGREYEAFLEGVRGEDPGAFADLSSVPRFVAATPGTPLGAPDRRAAANDALRALLQKD